MADATKVPRGAPRLPAAGGGGFRARAVHGDGVAQSEIAGYSTNKEDAAPPPVKQVREEWEAPAPAAAATEEPAVAAQ